MERSPDVVVRPASPGVVEAIARIHVASSRVAYSGVLPDAWLETFTVADRARKELSGSGQPIVEVRYRLVAPPGA